MEPMLICDLLGSKGDLMHRRGEVRRRPDGSQGHTYARGLWSLAAASAKPADLDRQITAILGQLATELDVWVQIAAKYDVDMFCGLFLSEANEDLQLSPDTLNALGQRRIELQLDIYYR